MQIKLVIPPERSDELFEKITKDYLDIKKEEDFRGFVLMRGKSSDIILSSDMIKDRDEIWKLNLELMDKYKITGTIIDYR